jgi:terminal uridylyltransferase
MSGPPPPAGGLEHLIEKLRLSDNARPHSRTGSVETQFRPPPTSGHPHSVSHQQYRNVYPQQNGYIPPQSRQGQFPTGPTYPAPQNQRMYQQPGYGRPPQAFQQQMPSHASPRGVSLMDYVKSPGNQNAPPQQSSQQSPNMPRNYPQAQSQSPRVWRQREPQAPRHSQHFDTTGQIQYLEQIAQEEIPKVAMDPDEIKQKQEFRILLESTCQKALNEEYPESHGLLNFIPYGSMLSGFAVKGSDMDIICSINGTLPDLEPEIIPRLLEIALLKTGIGARALTRTRVPILKICQKPTEQLHSALLEEYEKWKEEKDNPKSDQKPEDITEPADETAKDLVLKTDPTLSTITNKGSTVSGATTVETTTDIDTKTIKLESSNEKNDQKQKEWRREKSLGPLDFPKSGVGFQCDISFRGLLGVHNTQLLRCYSACDPRVREMVLFVKSWAKKRKINNSYSGTLCSYGWVLLVLHFLMNVARPPVLPNLQLQFGAAGKKHIVDGHNVAFADDEVQLQHLAIQGQITQNKESLGALLRNFFHYYAHQGGRVIGGGFHWKEDVISIRNQGGLVSKASKGWTGASNTMVNNVEVRQRYLLAVECPIETDHNVARTVHHYGVVAIRDELRRAWSILEAVRNGRPLPGSLFDSVDDEKIEEPTRAGFSGQPSG